MIALADFLGFHGFWAAALIVMIAVCFMILMWSGGGEE